MAGPAEDEVLERAAAAAAGSELVRDVARVGADGGLRFALGDTAIRPLTAAEVCRLRRQGNHAEDWSAVRVAEGFDPVRVRESDFYGRVVLGRFRARDPAGALGLPAGVYRSTLADCVVGHDAVVRDVRLLARCVVGAGAVLLDCGRVICDGVTAFGNGAVLSVGPETGGRPVPVFAELDVETAAALARPRDRRRLHDAYACLLTSYLRGASSDRGVVGPGARLVGVAAVRNSFVGPGACLDGATLVADSTLLSTPDEPTRAESGACVRGSLLQWGSGACTGAVVERSLLAEHSHVGGHARVTGSILGANTAVGGGEVTACLLGPFVAAHHQSLLIATLWPGGKGNVGYGANVGSNHTSRAPDQELHAGEGMFFGLGVNVKFPADFTRSPYTVVASGADLLPQKVAFPFSLIAPPAAHPAGVPAGYMEIIPAWVLGENLYALRRSEAKFRARNRARRARSEPDVLRPDTVELMRDACSRLEGVGRVRELYTDADIAGLGKNILRERHRLRALQTYRFFIRHGALMALAGEVRRALAGRPGRPPLPFPPAALAGDNGLTDVPDALRELVEVLETMARAVEDSRARDDHRGARVLDDYAVVHPPAAEDDCVRKTWEQTRSLQAELKDLRQRWLSCVGPGRAGRHPVGPGRGIAGSPALDRDPAPANAV
jgi:hypothetical protein